MVKTIAGPDHLTKKQEPHFGRQWSLLVMQSKNHQTHCRKRSKYPIQKKKGKKKKEHRTHPGIPDPSSGNHVKMAR